MDNSSIRFCILVFVIVFSPLLSHASPPPIFIFGDSTVDVGTNTLIPDSLVRADFPYYGIDFINSRPTGRFSNGYNIADFLSKLFGLKRSPQPYLFLISRAIRNNRTSIRSSLKSDLQWRYKSLSSASRKKMFRGVNFASGGSSISGRTAELLNVVPLSEQVNQFMTVRIILADLIGESLTNFILSKSIFFVSTGSNDIIEYIQSNSTVPNVEFVRDLMTAYSSYIRVLYDLGARKFGIISALTTGCSPSQRILNATGGCFGVTNDLSISFHSALDLLLTQINLELLEFRYSLGNMYELIINIIQNQRRYKLKCVDSACCGSGRLNAERQCNISTNLCKKRSEYLFWDLDHLTKVAARLVAQVLYVGEPRFVSPINFSRLAA